MIDKHAVTATVVVARNVEQLHENLGAAGLHLDADATTALDEISAPQSRGYPTAPSAAVNAPARLVESTNSRNLSAEEATRPSDTLNSRGGPPRRRHANGLGPLSSW